MQWIRDNGMDDTRFLTITSTEEEENESRKISANFVMAHVHLGKVQHFFSFRKCQIIGWNDDWTLPPTTNPSTPTINSY